MEVVKQRVRGWRWGEEPDGIDPSGPDGIYRGGSQHPEGQNGQLIPDGRSRHLFAHRKEGERVVRNFS